MITYLLGRASTGKFRYFIIECSEEWEEPQHGYVIQRRYGQIRGKETLSPEIVVKQTKANRTWKEQWTLQYNSEVKKQLDKGYIQVSEDPNTYSDEKLLELFGDVKTDQSGCIKPQLAKQLDKVTNKKILESIWMISRKLDGVKALFYFKDGEIHTASRGGSDYDISTTHIRTYPPLVKFFENNPTVILDGELFARNKSLQYLSGLARQEQEAAEELQYWIYDCYDTANIDFPAKHRQDILIHELNHVLGVPVYVNTDDDNINTPVFLLHQEEVSGLDNMMRLHDQYVTEGFEGAVIKDPSKSYKPGSRSNNLIKIKAYKALDFKVIDYELGVRGSEDMVFICELEDGRTFKAMPVGDRETKEEYVENFEEKYKNHLAECTFFNYSDDFIPTQPKLRIFRFDLE